MHAALWVSKTGLSAQDTKLNVISNNLANVATAGFKKDRAVFEDLLYKINRQPGGQSSQDTQLPSGLQLGTGVRMTATQKIFKDGNLEVTDNALDMAIDGRGFFQLLMPDGTTQYTRDGQFQIDSTGQIVNASGLPLQPAITVPETVSSITIGRDGTVTTSDAQTGAITQVGNIQVVDFINPTGLEAVGGNLYRETQASGAPTVGVPGLAGAGSIAQGAVESSNVNVVEELVNMISTQRAYEMNSKVISTADQMLQYIGQQL